MVATELVTQLNLTANDLPASQKQYSAVALSSARAKSSEVAEVARELGYCATFDKEAR